MLILLWVLYIAAATIFQFFFWLNLTKDYGENIDWVGHCLISICSITWPITLSIAIFDAFNTSRKSIKTNLKDNESFSIFVPQELLGIEGKDCYERVVAYLVGEENEIDEEIYVYHGDTDCNAVISCVSGTFASVYNGEDAESVCSVSKEGLSCNEEDAIRENQGMCAEQVHATE